MRKIIVTVLLLTLLLLCLWFYSHHHNRKPFRCDTQQLSVLIKAKKNIALNASVTIVFSSKTTGIVYVTGSLKEEETRYLLSRKLFFTITPSELENASNTLITHEDIRPSDNTPDSIWRNIVLPEMQNVSFYTQIIPLLNNALLVQSLTNPLLICTRQD